MKEEDKISDTEREKLLIKLLRVLWNVNCFFSLMPPSFPKWALRFKQLFIMDIISVGAPVMASFSLQKA